MTLEPHEDGSNLLLFRITRFNDGIRAAAGRVPDSFWREWCRLAQTNFRVCLGIGLGLLTVALAAAAGWVVDLLLSLSFTLPESQPTPPQLPPLTWELVAAGVALAVELAIALASLALSVFVAGSIFWIGYHVILIAFLPGLALHEFGHAVTVLKHGGDIDSVGLAFIGPFVMGAFVEPNQASVQDFTVEQTRDVYATGIIHNVALAWALYVLSIAIPQGLASAVLLWVAAFEVANAIMNALPIPKVDGGEWLLADWFTIDSIDYKPSNP